MIVTTQAAHGLVLDPVRRLRTFVAINLDARGVGAIARFGRVSELPAGSTVSDSSLEDINSIVVGVGVSRADLDRPWVSSPFKTSQLFSLMDTLRRAHNSGVECIVVENTVPFEPHSGVLRGCCDTYIPLGSATPSLAKTGPHPSDVAEALFSHYSSSIGGATDEA